MRLSYIRNAVGLILMLFGVVMLAPVVVALIYGEKSSILPFVTGSFISIISGFLLRHGLDVEKLNDLKRTEGLFIVFLSWLVIAMITGIPYLFFELAPIDAFFEAMSGITTTGATILKSFDGYSHAFFFWRSMSQWLGGMGILVLFIAILPQFAVAGRQLFFAEAPGPTEEKITPRIRHTATALWSVYIFLTFLEIILLHLAGMPMFDSVCNSFSTIAAGGFSPNGYSIAGYESSLIEWIVIVFMFLAGASFVLQYKIFFMRQGSLIKANTEFKVYLAIVVVFSAVLATVFFSDPNFFNNLRTSLFQIISILTTTGFASENFELWTEGSKTLLFLMMFIGGCAGSAGGGVKVVRIALAFKYMRREIKKALHPSAVMNIKLGQTVVQDDVLKQIISFILFYFVWIILSSSLVSIIEGDFAIAITGSAATLGNIGPGFGMIGPMGSYGELSLWTKIIFCLNMLVGRLELVPFLIMFHRDFWKLKWN